MFPKNQRITNKKDFDLVFKRGKVFHSPFLSIRILKTNSDKKRFSVLVSKKVSSKATERNKIKRLLREAIKKNSELFPTGSDSVLYAQQKSIDLSLNEAIKIIQNILKKS